MKQQSMMLTIKFILCYHISVIIFFGICSTAQMMNPSDAVMDRELIYGGEDYPPVNERRRSLHYSLRSTPVTEDNFPDFDSLDQNLVRRYNRHFRQLPNTFSSEEELAPYKYQIYRESNEAAPSSNEYNAQTNNNKRLIYPSNNMDKVEKMVYINNKLVSHTINGEEVPMSASGVEMSRGNVDSPDGGKGRGIRSEDYYSGNVQYKPHGNAFASNVNGHITKGESFDGMSTGSQSVSSVVPVIFSFILSFMSLFVN
ncbi:uncharacterized protein LOC142320299 [Lycorma delicatula]|uniref:uncharacterized protein LOC142320299 n=1 Tax=Lycorma delicatula TaxID=130591 RepID=UPI003F514F0D